MLKGEKDFNLANYIFGDGMSRIGNRLVMVGRDGRWMVIR